MQVVAPLLTMLTKEMDANASAAAMLVCGALVRECRDRLDVMAAQNETAFLAVAHALHAELGASVAAGTQQATPGSEPADSEGKAEGGAPHRKKARTQAVAADDELPSFYAKQAVCSGSHATRFLFTTLALAESDPRAASSTDIGSTVRQQLRLALSHGVPPAIGEALGEMLLTVCSAAPSDLSRDCRRILLQAATGTLGPCAVLSYALDRSKGGLTRVPYMPEPAAEREPGLLFAARVDVTALAAERAEEDFANRSVDGCGKAFVGVAKRPAGEAIGHVPDAFSVGVQLAQLPLECKLPAVGCLVREEEVAAFLAAPIADWKTISEGLLDEKGHQKAAWYEVPELNKFSPSVSLSLAPGVRVLLLHAPLA